MRGHYNVDVWNYYHYDEAVPVNDKAKRINVNETPREYASAANKSKEGVQQEREKSTAAQGNPEFVPGMNPRVEYDKVQLNQYRSKFQQNREEFDTKEKEQASRVARYKIWYI